MRSILLQLFTVMLDGVAHRIMERFNGVRLAHDRLLGPGTEGLECICESGHSSGIALLGNVIASWPRSRALVCASVRVRSALCAVQAVQLCRQRRLQRHKSPYSRYYLCSNSGHNSHNSRGAETHNWITAAE